jgi:hypothetical protein
MYVVDGQALCLSCWRIVRELQQADMENLMRMHDVVAAGLEHALGGYPVPRFGERQPVVHSGPVNLNTLQNINVTGGNVGAINTGTVEHLDVTLTNIKQSGGQELASALSQFVEAVLNAGAVSAEDKNSVVEQVDFLAEQAALPSDDRNKGVVSAVMARVREFASTVTSAAGAWAILHPILRSVFGV